ncbi:MAG: UDP-N-acetylmuramate dehydrogenase [Chloroflexi bacterium]|nr:UDP-N-acetylmuramate dehydrogenase [Chloroflexota bacterium]
MKPYPMDELRAAFGDKLHENISMADFTTARIGGSAIALIPAHTAEELSNCIQTLWRLSMPFIILGSGSNVLVSDKGIGAVIVYNRAQNLKFDSESETPSIEAESGANLGTVARQSALRGLSGMEWAAPIPGTVGGAVYGNAGAYGKSIKGCLKMAKILHKTEGEVVWPVEKFAYQYRTSVLKREKVPAIILSATFKAVRTSRDEAWEKIDAYQAHRKETQPPGASMGSTFKNPAGDSAGRLIEAAGLKGHRIGRAIISPIHANFIVNMEGATAQDIYQLIVLMQKTVEDQFGVHLQPEIELLGDFN